VFQHPLHGFQTVRSSGSCARFRADSHTGPRGPGQFVEEPRKMLLPTATRLVHKSDSIEVLARKPA